MTKTLFLTGATSGIGKLSATRLAAAGHRLFLHGRSEAKLRALTDALPGEHATFVADLSRRADVDALATALLERGDTLDVLINNAGVFKTPERTTVDGLDARFAVNTVAPFVLTRRLLPLLADGGRVVNVSSAAQNPVDIGAMARDTGLADFEAYAQSKLALTMWSCHAGRTDDSAPTMLAVNPGSMLGTAMVREGFGVEGKDVAIGADILVRAALAEDFASPNGRYFDNDAGVFAPPHRDALDDAKCAAVVAELERIEAAG